MKHILITGVSSGIGYAIAKTFIQKGYHVFGSIRKQEDAQRLCQDFGVNYTPLVFDITDNTAIVSSKAIVEKKLAGKGLDCLVNNAGINVNGPLAYVPLDEVSKQLEVNVISLLRVVQIFLPLLGFNSSHKPGKIVNISSVAGKITRQFMAPYAASKHAVEAISDGLRRELSDFGIQVIVIQPGPISSKIWSKAREGKNRYQNTPYEKIYNNMDKAVDSMENIAIPASKVGELVFSAVESKKPKTRYLISPNKWLSWLAIRVFSDRFIDKMMNKQIAKLNK